jgi:histidine phosphotransferase ChpT
MTETGSALTWSAVEEPPSTAAPEPATAVELASMLAARMCHDFISPASAIVSGVDLLDDPAAADMREDAMKLIESSAKKLVAFLAFTRVAFGGSSSAELFDPRELERLTQGVFEHVRASLDWAVDLPAVSKPCARALLNLAQIAAGALPTGGMVKLTAARSGADVLMAAEASGTKVRLRHEVLRGLDGLKLEDGLSGHWVQAYYLHLTLRAAGGALDHAETPERVVLRARCPAGD